MVRGSWPISGHPHPRSLIHGPRTRMSTDESWAWNQRSSTRSRRGFSLRAGSSTQSRRGFSRKAKTRTRTRRWFSQRAKTRNRRVLLSPHTTALHGTTLDRQPKTAMWHQRRWTWTGDFKCREVKTGFCRKRWTQTGSSGTLIGWKSGQTTFIPLWDRMEGAWLWTQYCFRQFQEIENRAYSISNIQKTEDNNLTVGNQKNKLRYYVQA